MDKNAYATADSAITVAGIDEEKKDTEPGSFKRKVTLNSFNIGDILLPSVTNKILTKSPQNKLMSKTSIKHSPVQTPREKKVEEKPKQASAVRKSVKSNRKSQVIETTPRGGKSMRSRKSI